jgi:hypothetical protein
MRKSFQKELPRWPKIFLSFSSHFSCPFDQEGGGYYGVSSPKLPMTKKGGDRQIITLPGMIRLF